MSNSFIKTIPYLIGIYAIYNIFVKNDIQMLKQRINDATTRITNLESHVKRLLEERNDDNDWIDDFSTSSISSITALSYLEQEQVGEEEEKEIKEAIQNIVSNANTFLPRTNSISEKSWLELTKNILLR